jgi:acid phosphatase (class A)
MRMRIALGLVVALLAAEYALAEPPVVAVDAARLLPPPPADGSVAAKDDLAAVEAAVARRSQAEFDAAKRDAEDGTGGYFVSAIGPGFDLAKLPRTKQLLDDVGKAASDPTTKAKAFFHRERPYVLDPALQTCTPHKPGASPNSYPSGHSTDTYAKAVVLAALLPAKAQAILARAEVYARNRVICGVHFPSDVAAGQAFGTAIGERLLASAAFQPELDAARAELAAAGL